MKKIYDLDNLSDNEVIELIEYEKNPTDPLKYNDIYNQIVTTFLPQSKTFKCSVKDNSRNIVYKFNAHTTPISTNFSIGLIIDKNKYHLLRFDFGKDLRHINDFGTDHEKTIIGSHVHIYAPSGKYIPKNVIPISSYKDFKNLKSIVEVMDKFVSYVNIKV